MNLNYLKNSKGKCNIDALLALKEERESWINRDSSSIYREALNEAPIIETSHLDFKGPEVIIGLEDELVSNQKEELTKACKKLIPWRKGPFNLFNLQIDAEWRSDQKWDRLESYLPNLKGKNILDIGCNNGYFMFKMAEHDPNLVLGIDPVLHNQTQFKLLQKYAKHPNLHFELFGIEHLNHFENFFDVVFSMGIIYHHRNPMAQLLDIKKSLAPGGKMILETIGIPGDESYALYPEDRYAKMRNVWFVPTLSCFINWVKRAKFKDVEVIADTDLTDEEQRLTEFCPPPRQSLNDFLDPEDKSKTIEGYPAPRRFCLIATA